MEDSVLPGIAQTSLVSHMVARALTCIRVVQSRVIGLVLRSVSWRWAVFYLEFLDLAWHLGKPKTSSKFVGWDMVPRSGSAVRGCWTGLKRFSGWCTVSSLGSLGPLWLPVQLQMGCGP